MGRSSWIIQVDPKCHHVYPNERLAEGDATNEESNVRTEAKCYPVA